MRFKGTLALTVVFLALGGYVYLTEFRGQEERQQAEEAKKKALSIEQKDIVEISLIFPDRTITGVKKGEAQWEMTSPAGVEADSQEWELLAGNIPRVEREQTVAENAADVAPFGLKDPPVKVVAKLADGSTTEVHFGTENPRKTFTYAKLSNSNDVFLTPSSWPRIFSKTVSDLRNKVVLNFESDNIDSIKVVEGDKETELQKSGEEWQVKKPIDTKADNGEATTYLSSIRFARASSFPEPPVDAKTAGLDPPAIRITLHDGKANTDHVLLVGKSAETDKFYAKDGSRDTIFVIEKDIAEKSRRPVFDWREKSITRIPRDSIEEVEIVRGADKVSMKKVEADWKLPDGQKLQWDKVSGMLNTLEFDKAKDVIDAPKPAASYGLDKPRLEVSFKKAGSEILRLAFGSDVPAPEGIYIRTSESPAVKVVSKDVFDRFNVKAEDLIEPPTGPSTTPGPGKQ
jgi:hypothetical protein